MTVSWGLMAVNAMGVPKGEKASRRVLRRATEVDQADVIVLSEAADWLARDLVDTDVWAVLQHGPEGSAESGIGILARRDTVRLRGEELRIGSREGEGHRDRPIMTARLSFAIDGRWSREGRTIAAVHAPRRDAVDRHRDYLRELREVRADFKVGDFNEHRAGMERWVPAKQLRGSGVMWVAGPQRDFMHRVRLVDVGSDHLAPLARIRSGVA